MTIRVLVVDDSGFFRRRLSELINSLQGFTVIATADNGREAIEKAVQLQPDVITMDYEMPVMDGISAVREIMQRQPTPILMFSSLTYEGARITLSSLEAGAVDYLPKNFSEISANSAHLKQKLADKLRMVATAAKPASQASAQVEVDEPETVEEAPTAVAASGKAGCQLVAIGTSTGGPVALQTILGQLPANFSLPIVLVQHMPASFTKAFADRLNQLCQIRVKEAVNGDQLTAGTAFLAPGGQQLMISSGGRIKVLPGDDRLTYKPSVDITFASAANVFADKVLGVVLTGMGTDGCEGARQLKAKGARVWTQDEQSSVIYGMPMAVAKAGLSDRVLPLADIGKQLRELN